MRRIVISDATMKQTSENFRLTFKEKIELSKLLDKLGVDVIELEGIKNPRIDALQIKSISAAVTDSAGNVDRVSVGGVVMKGTELRSLLGLRSACFTWEAKEDMLVFFVTGYGHGVGMSQYGAEAMALAGADYREILAHYYTGTEVGPWR